LDLPIFYRRANRPWIEIENQRIVLDVIGFDELINILNIEVVGATHAEVQRVLDLGIFSKLHNPRGTNEYGAKMLIFMENYILVYGSSVFTHFPFLNEVVLVEGANKFLCGVIGN